MHQILQKYYVFKDPEIKELDGYENKNFLVTYEGAKFVLKTYPYAKTLFDRIQAEDEILMSLNQSNLKHFPVPVKNVFGSFSFKGVVKEKPVIIRMLTYLEGKLFSDVEHKEGLFASFGAFLAQMDKKLQTHDQYVIRSRQFEWDLQHIHLNDPYINELSNPKDRNLVRYFFQQFDENVLPVLPELRKSIIHNDANDRNVLADGDKVCGIFDFGDLVYAPLINELGIALPYAMLEKDEPVEWASLIVKAYHKILPLEIKEVDILYYLIAARLCVSVLNSAHYKKTDPLNQYIPVSEKAAWKLLYKWIGINPEKVKKTFRMAIGVDISAPKPVEQVLHERYLGISRILSVSYTRPLYLNRAAFQYIYDVYGNTFLDAYNNIPHVGHSHPRVVEAGRRQMARLNTNTRYLYDQLAQYAERLLSKFPESLNRVFFVNSGSEASDLAIRLARTYSGANNLMIMEHGYHGHTQTDTDISDYKFSNKKGSGQKEYIIKTTIPDTYRGKYKNNDGSAGQAYAADAVALLEKSRKPVSAFISEPIVGCGGQVPLARGYLKELYPAIRKQGGVCISDEVQTGFGRLGDYFWGFEAQEVVPDMVILGKPMGNGHPVGAVVTTREIAEAFEKGVEFFSSFGGNPVSCAIGLAVLNVLEEENLQTHAQKTGKYYRKLLNELRSEFECIGDVRGSGLFLGIDMIKDRSTLEPDTQLAQQIKNKLREKMILTDTDGPFDNVLKSKPPMCFNRENADQVVQSLYDILKTIPNNEFKS